MTIEKSGVPVFLDEKGEPIAILFFNSNRDRVVYMVNKASEEEIISLFGNKDVTIQITKK